MGYPCASSPLYDLHFYSATQKKIVPPIRLKELKAEGGMKQFWLAWLRNIFFATVLGPGNPSFGTTPIFAFNKGLVEFLPPLQQHA